MRLGHIPVRREEHSIGTEIILLGNSGQTLSPVRMFDGKQQHEIFEDFDSLHLTKIFLHIRLQILIALLPRLILGVDPTNCAPVEALRSPPFGDGRDPRNSPAPGHT